MSAAGAEAVWRVALDRVLKGQSFEDALVTRGLDGIAIQPLYPSDDRPALARGAAPVAILQRVDHPDPDEAGRLAGLDVEDGAAGLILCFAGSAGARGFGLSPEGDGWRRTLSALGSGRTALRLELPPLCPPDLPLAVADAAATADLDIGLDPLGGMARMGGAPHRWCGLADGLCATVERLRAHGVTGRLLRADGRPVSEAGGTDAQELAAALAVAVAYLRALEARGFALDDVRQSLGFTVTAGADVLRTIAKCRALRVLWGGIEAACGLPPTPLRLHVETAWRSLTRRDPWTNIVRGTLGCAAAILGGADSVTVLPFTSALGLPDAAARRLARNTPLILLEEAHLGRVLDPGAGAGAVAGLTDALTAEAWPLFQTIEGFGGLPNALLSGAWQALVARSCLARQEALTAGALPLVGSTLFVDAGETPPAVLLPAPESASAPAAMPVRCPALASGRDAEACEAIA